MELWIAVLGGFGTLFGMGGIGGAIVAYRKVNILKDKTEVDLDRIKEQSFRDLIKELSDQRQHEAKEHNDCEAEKAKLREAYENRIEDLLDERDLFRTRILTLKTLLIEAGVKLPDGV